jgi:hypothetical protein
MSAVLLSLLLSTGEVPAATPATALQDAVDCVMAAWNAYDTHAARNCYAEKPVARNAHGVVPVDWASEGHLRAFDRAARSRFRAEVRRAEGDAIEYRLHETNDFLTALGLDGVSALWRYTVRDGRIEEEELLDADASFRSRLRKFMEWGRTARPAGWQSVVDSEGSVRFDGETASRLIAVAKEWQSSQP